MKKILLSAAVAAALGGAVTVANAASTILFNPNGTGAAGAIQVITFDWGPDNALAQNSVTSAGISPGPFTVFGQAKLANFVQPGNVFVASPAGREFTLFANFSETAIPLAGGAVALLSAVSGGSIQIWTGAPDSNQITGTGYNNGSLILQGSVVAGPLSSGTFTDQTRALGTAVTNLDNHGANDAPGVLSHVGQGSNTVEVNVTFADPNYFVTNITSLVIDAEDTGQLRAPFAEADPSDAVGGQVPKYGNIGGTLINGDCSVAQVTCDFHFQTDDSTSFNVAAVPEPASIALVALGLLSIGGLARKRSR
jgi:hypothetical protein